MKSALKLIAFTHADRMAGIVSLLETALEALDEDEAAFAASYVDMAIHACLTRAADRTPDFAGIEAFQ